MLTFPLLGRVRHLMRFSSHGVKFVGASNSIKLGKRQFAIGSENHTKHLSEASFPASTFPVKGRVHGMNLRLMVPLVCRYNGNKNSKPHNVWFLVDLGSPHTSLTAKSLETLVGPGFSHVLHSFAIQDPSTNIECYLSKTHFSEVNLLGMNAMRRLGLSIDLDWDKETFELIQK